MFGITLQYVRCCSYVSRRLLRPQVPIDLMTHRTSPHHQSHQYDTCFPRSSSASCEARCVRFYSAENAHVKVGNDTPWCFQHPLSSMHNLNKQIQNKLDLPALYTLKFRRGPKGYITDLHLLWPEIRLFTAEGRQKKTAHTAACLQALHWLYENNLITADAHIILKSIADSRNKLLVDINEATLSKIDSVLQIHSEEIVPVVSSNIEFAAAADHERDGNLHPTLGIPFPSSEDLNMWNEKLKLQSIKNTRKMLPIDDFRHRILKTIQANVVTIIKGETGCGKTTRVPQFILEDAITEGCGAYCNIVVVQPRRLTTIQTAKYVAAERGEKMGESVGYNVKMARVLPSVIGGSITFMTGMKLAHKFQNSSLQGVSHVVLDEVHLRDIGTDLVMTLLRRAMRINSNLRVIIMSATVDTSVFQSYFSQLGEIAVVEVPGRTFPVKMHFLDNLPSRVVHGINVQAKDDDEQKRLQVDFNLVSRVVKWIDKEKPDGGILIFVSGWSDMAELQKLISREENLLIIPVHSMFRDCTAAFEPAPKGKRKVILATNIAETSITFPDIVYVVDCGIHKKPQRTLLSPAGWSSTKMSTEWITKANVFQRRGRAGRVQPGESFHLFKKEVFDQMNDYELPGIMCESLEYLILSIKMVNPKIKAADLLKEFPTPPSTRDVKQAVSTLQEVSLLSRYDEQPTALATAVMNVSSSLPSAMALIYSAIFRCFSLTASITACEEAPLILGSREENGSSMQRSIKASYHNSSDHLAKTKIITDSNNLVHASRQSFFQAKALKNFYGKQIMSMSKGFYTSDLDQHINESIVLGILLKCFGFLVVKSHLPSMKSFLRDKSGCTASIRQRSVNHKLENPFVMYLSGTLSRGDLLALSDTSVISPLSVLLFLPSRFKTSDVDAETTVVQAWRGSPVRVVIAKEHYARIMALRRALRDVGEYFVVAEALGQPDEHLALFDRFRGQLLECLAEVLADEASTAGLT